MRYELRIQDPTQPPRSPLFDLIVALTNDGVIVYGRLFFGFLTGTGMDALLAVPPVAEMLRRAEIDVLVGLDAVTDRAGLQRLLGLAADNPNFHPVVIKNTTGALIHPKMLFVRYDDGSSAAVVGSNNLSFGGLNGNVEGYSVARFDSGEEADLSDWDLFLTRWAPLISLIDDEALASAERNEHRLDRLRLAVQETAPAPDAGVVVSDGQAHEASPTANGEVEEPILVAQIPKASNRWSQVHYSADTINAYFEVEPGDHIYLRAYDDVEVEDRQLVYSDVNKNYKIELGAAREMERTVGYPVDGRPVVVFRRESDALHRYRYALLMPGDDGHAEMIALSDGAFEGPSNHLPRVIVPRNDVLAAWPGCPL